MLKRFFKRLWCALDDHGGVRRIAEYQTPRGKWRVLYWCKRCESHFTSPW